MAKSKGQSWWADVVGYEGLYRVSRNGDVWSIRRHKLLTASPDSHGHLRVGLTKNKKLRTRNVHKLVAEAFIGPCPFGQEVRHLDDVKLNNLWTNIHYGTHAENMQDIVDNGNHLNSNKTHCDNGHELSGDNVQTNPSHPTWRECKQCHADRQHANLPVIRERRRRQHA